MPGGPTISTPLGPTAPARVAFRMLEEVDHLRYLSLGVFVAGHIGEAGLGFLLVIDLGTGPANAHEPPGGTQGPLRCTANQHEETDEEREGKDVHDDVAETLTPPELGLVAVTSTLCSESRAASASCGGTVGICDE